MLNIGKTFDFSNFKLLKDISVKLFTESPKTEASSTLTT